MSSEKDRSSLIINGEPYELEIDKVFANTVQ